MTENSGDVRVFHPPPFASMWDVSSPFFLSDVLISFLTPLPPSLLFFTIKALTGFWYLSITVSTTAQLRTSLSKSWSFVITGESQTQREIIKRENTFIVSKLHTSHSNYTQSNHSVLFCLHFSHSGHRCQFFLFVNPLLSLLCFFQISPLCFTVRNVNRCDLTSPLTNQLFILFPANGTLSISCEWTSNGQKILQQVMKVWVCTSLHLNKSSHLFFTSLWVISTEVSVNVENWRRLLWMQWREPRLTKHAVMSKRTQASLNVKICFHIHSLPTEEKKTLVVVLFFTLLMAWGSQLTDEVLKLQGSVWTSNHTPCN